MGTGVGGVGLSSIELFSPSVFHVGDVGPCVYMCLSGFSYDSFFPALIKSRVLFNDNILFITVGMLSNIQRHFLYFWRQVRNLVNSMLM